MRNITFSFLIVLPLSAGPIAYAVDPPAVWPDSVSGYGLSIAGAKQHGLKEAVRLVSAYIHQMDPPLLDWEVTEEFVEQNLLVGPGSLGKEVPFGKDDKGPSWNYRLKPADHELFIRLNRQVINARLLAERQAVSADRSLLAGWIFGGVLVVLAAAMAYGRLAERHGKSS